MTKLAPKQITQTRHNGLGWYGPAIFVLALVVRLLHIWQIHNAPFFELLMGDAKSYSEWARQIASGDWLGTEVFYQAPLYPYFLGTVYTIFNSDLLTVRLAQAVLGALSCLFLANAGRRFFSRSTGIIAGFILAIYAPAIFFDALIQKSVLDIFFLSMLLWLLSKITAQPDKGLWFLTGLVCAALTLTRENALIFVIAILIWLFVHFRKSPPKPLPMAAMFLLGLMVLLLPVAIRNKAVGGRFHLTTSQLGPNFYIGNNENANGIYKPLRPGRGSPKFERLDAVTLAEDAMGKKLTSDQVSRYWLTQSLDYITSKPADWLRLKALTLALVFKAEEIIDTEDQYTHAEFSLPLRVSSFLCHFGMIAPAALLGICFTWNRRNKLWLLYLMAALYAASIVAFYVLGRYRYPLVPFLILFAAAALTNVRTFLRSKPALQIAGCTALIAAAAVFSNWPMVSKPSQQAITCNNMANALALKGKPDEAIEHYLRALKLDPDNPGTYGNMGIAFSLLGNTAEAIRCYDRALQMNPEDSQTHYNLGKELASLGKMVEATSHFQKGVLLDPRDPAAHCNLGKALAQQGKLDEAFEHLYHALEIDPDFAKAHNDLCVVFNISGMFDKAVEHGLEAVRIDPEFSNAYYNLGAVFSKQGKINDAIGCWTQTIRLDPDNYKALSNVATAFYNLGHTDRAIEYWRKALKINPNDEKTAYNLKMVLQNRAKNADR